jgi:hypothetical protein
MYFYVVERFGHQPIKLAAQDVDQDPLRQGLGFDAWRTPAGRGGLACRWSAGPAGAC